MGVVAICSLAASACAGASDSSCRRPTLPRACPCACRFFWRSECLGYSVYRNGEHVAKALRACQKTHVESKSWLHLVACFGDFFMIIFASTWFLVVLGFCIADGVSGWLTFVRVTSVFFLYDVFHFFQVHWSSRSLAFELPQDGPLHALTLPLCALDHGPRKTASTALSRAL